jgi:hypothetical protein
MIFGKEKEVAAADVRFVIIDQGIELTDQPYVLCR